MKQRNKASVVGSDTHIHMYIKGESKGVRHVMCRQRDTDETNANTVVLYTVAKTSSFILMTNYS